MYATGGMSSSVYDTHYQMKNFHVTHVQRYTMSRSYVQSNADACDLTFSSWNRMTTAGPLSSCSVGAIEDATLIQPPMGGTQASFLTPFVASIYTARRSSAVGMTHPTAFAHFCTIWHLAPRSSTMAFAKVSRLGNVGTSGMLTLAFGRAASSHGFD